MMVWKRYLPLNRAIVGIYVRFLGCKRLISAGYPRDQSEDLAAKCPENILRVQKFKPQPPQYSDDLRGISLDFEGQIFELKPQ